MTIVDNVPRKALTEMIFDLKEKWAEGKSEASAQLVLGASYCLALQGDILSGVLIVLGLWSTPVQSPLPLPVSCYLDEWSKFI